MGVKPLTFYDKNGIMEVLNKEVPKWHEGYLKRIYPGF